MIWQAVTRLLHPAPVQALIPIVAGLAAAAANYGVACLLRVPARHNAAVRLAYLHNRGDVLVSLAPVGAGMVVALTGRSEGDVLTALMVALWLTVSTVRELRASMDELLWPEQMTCDHPDHFGMTTFPSGTNPSIGSTVHP
jgi:cobalt-zinc-cadmium efflux system protein